MCIARTNLNFQMKQVKSINKTIDHFDVENIILKYSIENDLLVGIWSAILFERENKELTCAKNK